MTARMHALPEIDQRYHVARDLEQSYVWPGYDDLASWEARASWLREHILAVLGLWPMPEGPLSQRLPLKTRITGRIEYDDYIVENVAFESWPGFYCTGNLYRPREIAGPVPGILNPHGHWDHGRFEHGERGSIPARCVAFARMGMVAFAYDMVGYNDSLQVPRHRFQSWRGALWGLSPMALQTWNSLRAVDLLQSLPDVDPERIGCTGASGGGTQTFILTAVEPRIKVAAPVNMISAHYQGGCVCENAPGLRIDAYNVEIAALTAPRPLLMVSATGDWTVNTPSIEYPAVRSIYHLYGAEERVACVQIDAPHNYSAETREHVYAWFARWFLGDEALARGIERPFTVEPEARLRVFPSGALPDNALSSTVLERAIRGRAQARIQALKPVDAQALADLQRTGRTRLRHILGVRAPGREQLLVESDKPLVAAGWRRTNLALGRDRIGDRIAAQLYRPLSQAEPTGWVVLVHGAGASALTDGYGDPGAILHALLGGGYAVLTGDVHYTGSVPEDALPRRDSDWFYATHNRSLVGERVQDILTMLAYAQGHAPDAAPVLVGLGEAGAWVLLAGGLSPVPCAVCVDWQGMEVDRDEIYLARFRMPAFCAYGGLAVASVLVAPRPMLVHNSAGRFRGGWARAAYQAAGASADLASQESLIDESALLSWLSEVLG